ncbi:TIR domain-containing protein [Sorangium sp. So ce861]|uniref:TIR domain-containing protein n=1 Tax=Sorangium sp. So ce861 TaxID=3133323 RepID=UPI003F5EE346
MQADNEPASQHIGTPTRIFISYAREDEPFLNQLEEHLAGLRRRGLIETWSSRKILPGTNIADEEQRALSNACIILILVSPSYVHADTCWEGQLQPALERLTEGKIHIVPIRVRPVDLRETPLARLMVLPTGSRAVTQWDNVDEAWLDVVSSVRRLLESSPSSPETKPSTRPKHVWKARRMKWASVGVAALTIPIIYFIFHTNTSINFRNKSCGNGALEHPEQCDDGNITEGDGCSQRCSAEPGFVCFGEPSSCSRLQKSENLPPVEPNVSAAEASFTEGVQAVKIQDYTTACIKFRESLEAAPAADTLINVAECFRIEGKLASAWVTCNRALAMIRSEQDSTRRNKLWNRANSTLAKIEPKIPKIRITIQPTTVQATVSIDGTTVAPSSIGIPIPLDPGTHTVRAETKDRSSQIKTVELTEGQVAPIEFSFSQ